jgi:hypothetical protein
VSPEANRRIRRKPTTDATPERAAVERRFIAMLDAPATLPPMVAGRRPALRR